MAFSFGGSPAGAPAAMGSGNAQNGPDLEDIQTENLGFLALSGESKVQLLPSRWPTEQLPPPTASLLSIAPHKGLLAAAGPDAVIVATTESVRKAFEGPGDGGNIKPYQPQLKIPMPQRISQVAFTADESYLVLSAENGGGLAFYDVQALLQNSTQTAFELSTNGQSLRALVPNPTVEKGDFLAVVTNDGNLMMANIKQRHFVSGPNGQVLKSGVSCVSWSTKGKQLVAGLGDGTAYQMTPEGEGKAEIPRPPNINGGDHISSITWLENHVFLVVHTPSSFSNNEAPASQYHVVTRNPTNNTFVFQKISDPAGPFGLNRSPPHQFILRLKDFPPHLQDVLLVTSSASGDIGLFSRSKVPLTNNKPADKVSNVFTFTEMSNDSRRAQLPFSADGMGDTSPIGFVLDLSSKDKVRKPIPGDDELEESPTPIPALMVLNNEGVLASWWVIYTDSLRQSTIYPGLVAAGGAQAAVQPASQPPALAPAFGGPQQSAFGAPAFGAPAAPSAFGAQKPAFGAPAFGAPSLPGPATGAFGGPSALGQKQSLWGQPATNAPQTGGSTFGTSAFGSSGTTPSASQGFAKFGASSTPLGMGRPSPWASGGSTAPNAAFGQSGGLAKPTSVFGSSSPATAAPNAGGFASFASTPSAFGTVAASSTTDIFGSKPASGSFLTPTSGAGSVFGGQKAETTASNPFGSPSSFVLGSTFKADPSQKEDAAAASNEPKGSMFGGAFGSALGEAAKVQAPVSQETEMESDDIPAKVEQAPATTQPTTPAATPAPPKTTQLFPTTNTPAAPAPSTLFGQPSNPSAALPKPTGQSIFGAPSVSGGASKPQSIFGAPSTSSTETSKPAPSTGFGFGQPSGDKPKSQGFSFANLGKNATAEPATPKASEQPASAVAKTPPSPPIKSEPAETPKAISQIPEDAPLPPDPTNATPKPLPEYPPTPVPQKKAENPVPSNNVPPTPTDVPGGPEDEGDDSDDFVTEDGSQVSEEGSGEDLGKDLSPTSDTQTPGFTPQNSFAPPKQSNVFTQGHRPARPSQSRLFGELGGLSAPVLPPPRLQGSPRSPSPVRSALPKNMQFRPDASRSVSTPGLASTLVNSQRKAALAKSKSTYEQSLEEVQAEQKRREELQARKDAAESQQLIDRDDDEIQKQLAEEVVGTRQLEDFIAHIEHGIPDNKNKHSIPAQVENVYRDINSMIDTLGLNAHALKCFVKGHTEQYKDEGRTKEDLDNEEDWVLVEVENLSALVENTLAKELENARVIDMPEKFEACSNLQRDIIRLRAKYDDLRKIIQTQNEPDQLALNKVQPLSAEQVAQRHDLRKEFTNFQSLLSEAEEGLTLLKAKLVSQAASSGRTNGSEGPTVDAIMRTITKMTSMAEKRSGDIDVLEGQMRKLRFSSVASDSSREGSPFVTPQNNRTSFRPGSSTYGLFYTPDSVKDSAQRFRNSLMSSVGSYARDSPRHKKMSGYTAEEKAQLREKLASKKEVKDKLRAALRKGEMKVKSMEED